MIKLVGIHKIYQDLNQGFLALKDVNLDFKDDHFVCVLGKSGSGKTTLLNIIGGLDTPSTGHMVIDGQLTTKFREAQWDYFRNYKIGFIFQNFSLIEHLNVLDNVKLAIKIQGINEEEAKKRSLEVLDKVGILDQAYKLPKKLSGGERQRVAIARAIINNPEIILADEPTGNLDKKTSKQIMDILKEISDEHLVIMVTHNRKLASKYADRIIELKDGMVSSDTKPYLNDKVFIRKPNIKNTRFRFIDKVKHAVKNIRMKKWRSFLISLGLAIGVSSFILLNGISNGIKVNIRENIGRVASQPDLRLYVLKEKWSEEKVDKFINKLLENKNVLAARFISDYSYLDFKKIKNTDINLTTPVTYNFTDEKSAHLLGKPYKDGRWPQEDDEIMISYSLATRIYDYTDIDVLWKKLKNVKINVVSEYYYEIPYEIFSNPLMTSYDFIDENTEPENYDSEKFGPYETQIAKQKELFGELVLLGGEIYIYTDYDAFLMYRSSRAKSLKEFTIVGINNFKQLDEVIVTKDVYFNIQNTFDYSFNEEIFEVYLTDKGRDNLFSVKKELSKVAKWVEDAENFEEPIVLAEIFVGIAQFIISLILVISVVTAGLMLLMVLLISIIERSREIGILRSLGATKSDILSVFVSESAVIGFFSGILGILISIVIMLIGNIIIKNKYEEVLLNAFNNSDINLIIITPLSCIIACFVCILLAMLFGLFPAIKASKKTPINALKRL